MSSPKSDSQVVVDVVSKAIVRSQSVCMSNALNKILVDVGRARNVNLENVQIFQLATTESKCSQSVEIDVESMEYDVQKALDVHIQVAEEDSSSSFALKTKVIDAINAADAKLCLASAINDFRVKFGTVAGDVNIRDLDIRQVANASVSKCIQEGKFQISDGQEKKPMEEFISTELKKMKSVHVVSLKGVCEEAKPLLYAIYGCVSGAALIVIIVFIWHMATRNKIKLITK